MNRGLPHQGMQIHGMWTEYWTILRTLSNNNITLKDLTLKLVTLMCLVSSQRGQTIHYLSLTDMIATETSVTFVLSRPIKQSKPGSKNSNIVKFKAFLDDSNICVVNTLMKYLEKKLPLCVTANSNCLLVIQSHTRLCLEIPSLDGLKMLW